MELSNQTMCFKWEFKCEAACLTILILDIELALQCGVCSRYDEPRTQRLNLVHRQTIFPDFP